MARVLAMIVEVLEVELVRDNPGQVHPEHRQSCGDTMSLHHSLRGAC